MSDMLQIHIYSYHIKTNATNTKQSHNFTIFVKYEPHQFSCQYVFLSNEALLKILCA